jgi:nitrite reductase (NADH) small subunit
MNARNPIEVSVTHWQPVCRLEDLPVLGARRWLQGPEPIAVFRNAQDQVFALADRCPHTGGPLSQGIVFGDRVAVRCTTGRSACPTVAPTRRTRLHHRLPDRVVDGVVMIELIPLIGARA